ncbi:MAG: tail fiber domain-containing protein [Dyadobacter sp.]|uniref:tail fiber domain-containing protein n=1 Tax=Dyadobacter sp. TaxID=1914288 RepID=UPI003266C441
MKFQKITFLLLCALPHAFATYGQAGRVGIGTTTPRAGLDVNHDDGIISTPVTGLGDVSNLPTNGGIRLMWIPKLAAFRAGSVDGSQWDTQNIGDYSVALGGNNTALGSYSSAFGYNNYTFGNSSTASGRGNSTSGYAATAFGQDNTAEGVGSVALGYLTTASGPRSIAMGHAALASGINSTSIGFSTRSGGISTLATGYETEASGNYSTAMGSHANTNGKEGAFVIGDKSQGEGYVESLAPNKFTARFANGYLLYTSADKTDFVALGPGGNAWITSSDSTRKTNFESADGEQFLQKLRGLRLGSWNYKKQDAKTMRHYGPMAQDFFSVYGHDGLGTIGNDTTLNAADVDGVAFILLKALEKRTAELTNEIDHLKKQLAEIPGHDNRRLAGTKKGKL